MTTEIKVNYSAVDGGRESRKFKSLAGAQKYAQHWIGRHPEIGSHYAVSGDGIGKIEVTGAALAELFPPEPAAGEKTYSLRRNARAAAKLAGLDPDGVYAVGDRWALPAPGAATAVHGEAPASSAAPAASDEAPAAAQVDAAVASVPPGEMPPLPTFLEVGNRVPLDAAGEARVKALLGRRSDDPNAGRVDHRKPQSMSWEEFDAHQAEAAEKKKAAANERIAKMKAKHPELAEGKPKREPRPTVADRLAGARIRLVAKDNPYREGTAGHAVFALYRDGMTIPAFEKKAEGKTGTRKPVDMLMHDVRKGRVALEKKEDK